MALDLIILIFSIISFLTLRWIGYWKEFINFAVSELHSGEEH